LKKMPEDLRRQTKSGILPLDDQGSAAGAHYFIRMTALGRCQPAQCLSSFIFPHPWPD
jgi:hypothetical protein